MALWNQYIHQEDPPTTAAMATRWHSHGNLTELKQTLEKRTYNLSPQLRGQPPWVDTFFGVHTKTRKVPTMGLLMPPRGKGRSYYLGAKRPPWNISLPNLTFPLDLSTRNLRVARRFPPAGETQEEGSPGVTMAADGGARVEVREDVKSEGNYLCVVHLQRQKRRRSLDIPNVKVNKDTVHSVKSYTLT